MQFLLTWPKNHLALFPKAHASADYHTFGAAGEMIVCYGLNVLASCRTTRTYNDAFQLTCTESWKTVAGKMWSAT